MEVTCSVLVPVTLRLVNAAGKVMRDTRRHSHSSPCQIHRRLAAGVKEIKRMLVALIQGANRKEIFKLLGYNR
jgi:hypothetical protein